MVRTETSSMESFAILEPTRTSGWAVVFLPSSTSETTTAPKEPTVPWAHIEEEVIMRTLERTS